VCDFGWPEVPCNIPLCDKHTTSVDQGDGTELDFCPGHKSGPRLVEVVSETHDTPEYITEALIQVGGLNRFGKPNYRVIWGGNRQGWVNGKLELLYKLIPPRALNRWIVEKWLPAEEWWGPRETWWQTKEDGVDLLGPYPEEGEYEHLLTIEGPNNEFLQLSPEIVRWMPLRIEAAMKKWNPRLSREAIYKREAKLDERYLNWADMVMDDNATWLHTPHEYLPAKLKEKIQ
jgi:hypothetical protein